MVNMSAKFNEEAHNGLVLSVFTSLFPYISIATLTSKLNRVHPLTMANTSGKFYEEAHNDLFCHDHKLISIFVYCDFDL